MLIDFLKSEYFAGIDELHLLVPKIKEYSNIKDDFINGVRSKYFKKKELKVHEFDIKPFEFASIFGSVTSVIRGIEKKEKKGNIKWHFQASSENAQMNVMWKDLLKTNHTAVLYETTYNKNTDSYTTKIYESEESVDLGTFDYLMKSFDTQLLKAWMDIPGYEDIIHKSEKMRKLLNNAYTIAKHDVPVLILGETGTGKELFARIIHNSSTRKNKKMKEINCAAINAGTADATLFGWSKGAYTGAVGEGEGLFVRCNGGTVFLDEIGELSLELQTKLLRVLQEGIVERVGDLNPSKTNVRIIAATNQNLIKHIRDGKFREDLYYRINVGILKLPPLRDRGDDVILLAEHFLEKINEEISKSAEIIPEYIPKKISKQAMEFIRNYRWPGNVRELSHVIHQACIWHTDETIDHKTIKNIIAETDELNSEVAIINIDHPVNFDVDAMIIAERILEEINKRNEVIISKYIPKKISKQALNFIGSYHWPGNTRELYDTIQRICIWHAGETIDYKTIKNFIAELPDDHSSETAHINIDNPINLDDFTMEFRKKYILKALEICGKSKVKAAEFLGYKNYQTLSNEMKRLRI